MSEETDTHQPAAEPQTVAPRNLSFGSSVFLFFFGVYLLLGAYSAFANSKWPIFVPPQIDVVGLLLGAFHNSVGVYLGGAFLAALGAACIVAPFVSSWRSDA